MRARPTFLALASIGLLACGGGATLGGTPTDAAADAAQGDAAPLDDGGVASRCQASPAAVTCPRETLDVPVGGGATRAVHHQVPLGQAPPAGWPLVLMFQGSFFSATHNFAATTSDPFGAYYQALTLKKLLDAGFAVLAPETRSNGSSYWDTNIPPWSTSWSGAPDDTFMLAIFAAMGAGQFGPLDATRMYATGISSGGYMTSRMAVSYAGKFKALAIASASYATCGPTCTVPRPLPSDHPPTLFLHGEQDNIVPISTMQEYKDALAAEGHTTNAIVNASAGHAWIPEAPDAVLAWFLASP